MKKSSNGKYNSLCGTFNPLNESKYTGSDNPKFKSKLEFMAMTFMDKSPHVLKWSYETVAIPYIDPTKKNREGRYGRKRKYYIDLIADIKTKNGIKKVWIEVKSKKETSSTPPKFTKRKNPRNRKLDEDTWRRNQAKWKTARVIAKKRGYRFIILTEDELR
jgi:hypothetical protein